MKNIKIIALLLVIFASWSCDPLKEEIKELDDNYSYIKDIEYTLTDDDYDLVDQSYGNFSTVEDAKTMIPAILNNNFPAMGSGSSAIVTYDFFNGSSPYLGDGTSHTVTEQEYLDLGYSYKDFDNLSNDLPIYATYKEPDASNGDYMDVTFDFYSGGTGFVPDSTARVVYTVAYGWQYTWVLPDEAYGGFFGESGIDFSYEDEGIEKMPVYLNYLTSSSPDFSAQSTEEGALWTVQFNYDDYPDASNVPTVALYIYSGTEWTLYGDSYQVTQSKLSFGNDGTTWVPDNTIKYSLNGDDYTAIGNAYASSNPSGSASILSYGNFDISLWSSDQIYESIVNRLLEIFPKEDGQKYLVTYATWEPGAGSGSIHVIYSEADGTYNLVEE